MFKSYAYTAVILVFLLVLVSSCSKDDVYVGVDPEPISPVNFVLDSLPYNNLSDYNFFEGNMADLKPVYGVLPYKITSGLFIDYAKAKTFVWMPKDSMAVYVNDYSPLDFPNGTILITSHYFDNVMPNNSVRMIETRLLIKKESEWVLVNYKWNDSQTDATFTTEGSFINVDLSINNTQKNITYRIPSYNECHACHNKSNIIAPIGPKPQNLNANFLFDDGIQNQLIKWIDFGYLEDSLPTSIESVVDWNDASQPLELRVRSYLDINCAHCHSDNGYCNYAYMRFEFQKTNDKKNMGVCKEAEFYINPTITHIVKPGSVENSALFYRISSIEDQYKMPLIGRFQKHEEGIQLIEDWINSLSPDCN